MINLIFCAIFSFALGVAFCEVILIPAYWDRLSAFLDRRDKIIFDRLRENKDHKI
jgi:hypothetical protein